MIALGTGGAAWGVNALIALSASGSGSGSDYGLDTDGDGAFEWLVVEAEVSLHEAGVWDVYADLTTSKPPAGGPCGVAGIPRPLPVVDVHKTYGPIAWAYERYFFPAGLQTVRMSFPGTDIGRAGVDGPYAVHALLSLGGFPDGRLRPPEPSPIEPPIEWNYTTQAYAVAAFEQPDRPASFTGSYAESTVDVDSDGLEDFFELTAAVHVNVTGHYTLSGFLSKASAPDVMMGVAYGHRDLDLSLDDASVYLRFRGDQIRQAGIDGPWDFALTLWPMEPYMWGSDGNNLSRPGHFGYPEMLCGSTDVYRAADFDDTVELLRYTGTFEEATPDFDRDGLHDVLVVRAEVEVLLSSGFDLAGTLRSEGGTAELAWARGQAWLPEGRQWTEFAFPGPEIRSRGVDGPYEATMSITPVEHGIDPMTTYVTRAYRATDFDDGPHNGTSHWIHDLSAAAADGSVAIRVAVLRGNDMLTFVIEDTLEVTVTDADGAVVDSFKASVFLPSGGSEQFFAFSTRRIPSGTYTVMAVLGPPDRPGDVRSVVVTV